jgi:MFS family permease
MDTMALTSATLGTLKQIPRGVWALGLVSMFMDISSEMIHALLPIYLVSMLGTSMTTVGFIEGVAEATAMITKVFSGALSDWLGKRKALTAIGYGLAAFTKPVFPLASAVEWFVAARFVDRIGKGIRGAPRDALLADIAPDYVRGASFGLRQSLDTVGAFLGPMLAIGLMLLTLDNFRLVFGIAVIPAFIAFGLLLVGVEEPARKSAQPNGERRLSFADARGLSGSFWTVVAIAAVFTLARFSEAFLVLKAQAVGLPVALVPAVMIVMNVVYAVVSYPAGALSDRFGRHGILFVGIGMLVVADLILAFGVTVRSVLIGVVFWGLHMGLTQGLLSALVADAAPQDLRGTAFGVFNVASGVAMLIASVLAGALWDVYGARMTFLAGAAFTAAAMGCLMVVWARFNTKLT